MTLISRRTSLLAGTAAAGIPVLSLPALALDMAEFMKPPELGEMSLGAGEDAKVTAVEYASATCPHCAHFHQTNWAALKATTSTQGACASRCGKW